VRPADVDESERPGEAPAAYVARVARAKADAVVREPGRWLVAADTTVVVDDAILAKAASPEAAAAMMRRLVGRVHEVLTAFVVVGDGRRREAVIRSEVELVPLDEEGIADYVASGDWRDKAGAYAIQGVAAALVRQVRGSVTNIVGLPLAEVIAALRELGGPLPALAAAALREGEGAP
jgi:septum formation protein